MTFRGRWRGALSESRTWSFHLSGSMSGRWRRGHGLASGAPAHERAGNGDATSLHLPRHISTLPIREVRKGLLLAPDIERTHPFSRGDDRHIYPRYRNLDEALVG